MVPYVNANTRSSTPRSGRSGTTTPTSVESVSTVQSDTEYDPIAIVGMGCRLPGDVRSANDLWEFLSAGKSGQGEVPPTRWNIDSFYHPNGNDKPGSMNMRGGYFINEDLRNFENSFFGINNLEATFMDPQQRKLLEVVYECFESAGLSLEAVSNANIGTYVGSFTTDFWIMQARDPEYWNRYNATGMGTTILGNRISHIFNLKGPSFVLDTACSSSLYALHLACTALDAGECEAAIVAAANLVQTPEQHIGTMKAGVLSPTGTCHTFDASADGYGRADGVGALYLKKLSKALADGDPIRSVIRGTAINSNGRTNGITLPSSDGQEAVIRKAYAKAGLSKYISDTSYVECHGTGTAVGDPIELDAVHRVFRPNGNANGEPPLLVGSVKTNMGHSEAASGITSIIKATLALENSSIPATIGLKTLNPKIKTKEWGVGIVTEQTAFPKSTALTPHGKHTKRLGINSFGYGGANAHAIIDSVEGYLPVSDQEPSESLSLARSIFLLPFSATNVESLSRMVQAVARSVDPNCFNAVDLAYTLASHRSRLATRGFALVSQKTLAADLTAEGQLLTTERGVVFSKLPIAFVFTGQGAQWPQMGKELIEESPSFRRSIQNLDAVLQRLPEAPSWTLQQAILDPKETSRISQVTRSQPVCTAIQVAYVELLARWGIKPVASIGHSSGEIGAAFAAGKLTAEQAIIIAFYRGHCVGNTTNPIPGGMMAAGLSKEASDAEIERLGLKGVIRTACVNSPESVTISGNAVGIEKILAELQAKGTFARKLNTDGRAYHSHHMELIGQDYQDLLEKSLSALPPPTPTTEIRSSDTKWISSVDGGVDMTDKASPAAYWRRNLESPVLFNAAVEALVKGNNNKLHLVELGPHSALELPVKQTRSKLGLTDADIHYNSALSRGKNANECVLNLMGQLYLHGHDIEFSKVNFVEVVKPSTLRQGKLLTSLPPYTWSYDDILWNEGRASQEFRHRKYPHHDLLGSQSLGGNGNLVEWRNIIKMKDIDWVEGHKLGNDNVFPAAGYLAMAVEAISQVTGTSKEADPTFNLRNFSISKALQLYADPNADGVEIFTTLAPLKLSNTANSRNWYEFSVMSFDSGRTISHAQGEINVETISAEPLTQKYPSDGYDLEPLAPRNWYQWFQAVGLNFGETFQTMKEIRTHRKKQIMHTRSRIPFLQGGGSGKSQQSDYVIHPITIDTMFQSAIIASTAGVMKNLSCKVPTMIESARFKVPKSNSADKLWNVDAISQPLGIAGILVAGEIHDGSEVVAQVQDVTAVQFQGVGGGASGDDERHPMLRVTWKPDIAKLQMSDSNATSTFVNAMAESSKGGEADLTLRKVAAVVDLVAHKNPRVKILELADQPDNEITTFLLNMLRADTAFKRFGSYSRGHLTEQDDELRVEDIASAKNLPKDLHNTKKPSSEVSYDLVIVPPQSVDTYAFKRCDQSMKLVASEGYLLSFLPSTASLPTEELSAVIEIPLPDLGTKIHLGRKLSIVALKTKKQQSSRCVVVEREGNESFNDLLIPELEKQLETQVDRVYLEKLLPETIKLNSTVISTIELNKPLLSMQTNAESIHVKTITDNAKNLIWVTGGENLKGGNPDIALVSGLSRALMLEQPSLRFLTVDIGEILNLESTVQNVIRVVEEAQNLDTPEWETVQQGNLLYCSRFEPEEKLNETFRQKQNSLSLLKPLKEAKGAQLTIQRLGQYDSLAYLQQASNVATRELKVDHVEVEVKSVALDTRSLSVFTGKETSQVGLTSSSDCAGVVTRIGSAVSNLQVGDRVVVMAPGHFATVESFPEWCCEKLDEGETYSNVSTLPTAFATASYALDNRGHLKSGESVLLVQAASSDISVAAIQLAKLRGANVFATVESEDDRQWLQKTFNVDNVIVSDDTKTLASTIKAATRDKGVDVVLNTAGGDMLHESWTCLSRFGRFIQIGRSDELRNAGKLDMQMFSHNATFSAFTLNDLYDTLDAELVSIWKTLLQHTMMLYRSGLIQSFDAQDYDVSSINDAFKATSSAIAKNQLSKATISFEDGESMIRVLPLRYDSQFSPDKWYLMIGCLGGLGRSMSKFMVRQGARKFVFLGRSGMDKPAARNLVEDLEQSGAKIKVVRGDVVKCEHVRKCVEVIGENGQIGGVIQAAMGLSEALWTGMSNEFWHTGIDPKVIGTWNLHRAIQGKDSALDFFLMTSSISGSVGTATESNYCAANYFLDVFARYRRSQGLPATSVGLGMISEVGYLHENPEIEALLLRKGIQAINEDELLQIIDCAIAQQGATSSISSADPLAASHILTGLEPHGIKKMRAQGFDANNPTLGDPRSALLAASLDGESDAALQSNSGLPPELAAAIDEGGEETIIVVCVDLIKKRFSNLILIPPPKIDERKPLNKFGMDSMLAAEFRTWFFQAFMVDIPFLMLLNESTTIRLLGETVASEVAN